MKLIKNVFGVLGSRLLLILALLFSIDVNLDGSKDVNTTSNVVSINETVNKEQKQYYSNNTDAINYTIVKEEYYNSSNILLSIKIIDQISSYSISSINNSVIYSNYQDDIISLDLYVNSSDDKIIIELLNDIHTETIELFIKEFEGKYFVNYYSAKQLEIDILDYQYISNYISIDEYHILKSDLFIERQPDYTYSPTNSPSLRSILNPPTDPQPQPRVFGELKWRSENNLVHPLAFVKVDLYDINPGQKYKLGSTFSDENGYFEIFYQSVDGDNDLQLQIFSTTPYATVKPKYSYSDHSFVTHTIYDVTTNDLDFFVTDPIFEMISDFGWAMQITQAISYAAKYASYLADESLDAIDVYYPGDGMYYSPAGSPINSTINIHPQQYWGSGWWDVIMHEYGHYFEDYYNFADTDHGGHTDFNEKSQTRYFIDQGLPPNIARISALKFAWSEGFATFFSLTAQDYYKSMLPFIPGVADSKDAGINANDGIYDIYMPRFFGDDSERSVMYFLYNLVDTNTTHGDNVSLSAKSVFIISKNNSINSITQFISLLSLYNYLSIDDLAILLNISGISYIENILMTHGNPNQSPYFRIILNEVDYDLNYYVTAHITDSYDNDILYPIDFTPSSFQQYNNNIYLQFTEHEWLSILSHSDDKFYVRIEVSKSVGGVVHGNYFSSTFEFTKPIDNFEEFRYSEEEFGFKQQYHFTEQTAIHEFADNSTISTKRLRTGFIQNEYIVLSPIRLGAGEAYLEYTFEDYVDSITFELAYWSGSEGVLNTASIDYYDQSTNTWIQALDLLSQYITTNRELPRKYTVNFSNQTNKVRIRTTANPGNNNTFNKGRLCIGDIYVDYTNKSRSISIDSNDVVNHSTVTTEYDNREYRLTADNTYQQNNSIIMNPDLPQLHANDTAYFEINAESKIVGMILSIELLNFIYDDDLSFDFDYCLGDVCGGEYFDLEELTNTNYINQTYYFNFAADSILFSAFDHASKDFQIKFNSIILLLEDE